MGPWRSSRSSDLMEIGSEILDSLRLPTPGPKGQWRSWRHAHSPLPCPQALKLGMRTLLTQTFCLVCNTQKLLLNDNKIGDVGMIKFSEACAGGALPQLKHLYLYKDVQALRAACEARGIIYH